MISKVSRQLFILHIFLCSRIIETTEIMSLINVSNKTIMRDIKELQNAGLLNIKFSRKEKGYVHIDDDNRCPFSRPILPDNKAKQLLFDKLIRLASIMIALRGHVELPNYDDASKNQETCSIWYRNKFPDLSTRTMQRDFKELNKIGYEIKYDRKDQYYIVDFPEGIEGISTRISYL
jgi:predicted DNA-binding transcriptional regulator YafY